MLFLFLLTVALLIAISTWWSGFWSNLIMFVNMLVGALVATAFFLNLSDVINRGDSALVNLSPFIAIWILFVATTAILRGATDTLSRLKLRFDPWTEMIGRTIMSLSLGFLFVAFVGFTLHFAPLPPFYYVDNPQDSLAVIPRPGSLDGTGQRSGPRYIGPERAWDSAVQYWSNGALSESLTHCLLNQVTEANVSSSDWEGQSAVTHRPWRSHYLNDLGGFRGVISRNTIFRVLPER